MVDSDPSDRDVGFGELSPQQLRSLFEVIEQPVFRLSTSGRIKDVNPAVVDQLGYEKTTLVGEPINSVIVGESTLKVAARTPECSSGNDSKTVNFRLKEGATLRAKVTTISLDKNNVLCVCRRMQTALPVEGSQNPDTVVSVDGFDVLQRIQDPVFVSRNDGTVLWVNEELLEVTGYGRSALCGRGIKAIASLSGERETVEGMIANVTDNKKDPVTAELELVTAEGESILTEAKVSTFETTGLQGVVGVLRDIREQKHRQRNLELLKQVLTRVFRHNIRNELMIMEGHAELLGEHVETQHKQHVREIQETTDRILSYSEKARLIERVIEKERQQRTDLDPIVEGIVCSIQEEYPDAAIETAVETESAVVAHPDIGHGITELIENAIQHAPRNGEPRVDIWIEESTENTILFVEDESGSLDEHEIRVLRSGSENELQHSSGVGLWLIRWLVEFSEAKMIAHPTDAGTVMGIKFRRADAIDEDPGPLYTTEASPLTRAPEEVRDIEPRSFEGDTLVGRIESYETLEATFEKVSEHGGRSVVVTGEAGIGKTTLIRQFESQLRTHETNPAIGAGECESSAQRPYEVFRQAFAELNLDTNFGKKLHQQVHTNYQNEEAAANRKQELFGEITSELREVATERPVVVILEDLHWADSGSLDLFEHLLQEVGQWAHPVMFLCSYRTSGVEESHPVLATAERINETGRGTVLELDSFGDQEVSALLSDQLGAENLPKLASAVREHTGGNPLFVNEIGKQLSTAYAPIDNGEAIPDSLEAISLPETVETAVTNRLDRVPAETRAVLELGAVLGRTFSFDVLRAASNQPVGALIESTEALRQREIWTRPGESIEFVHGVVREQALERIDQATKTQLHEQAATAIESVYAESLEQQAFRLGEHYEQLQDYETAFSYFRNAGDQAAGSYAYTEAIFRYKKAVTVGTMAESVSDEMVAETYAALANVHIAVGSLDESHEAISKGMEIVPENSRVRGRLLTNRARIERIRGNPDKAIQTGNEVEQLARTCDFRQLEANAVLSLGASFMETGAYSKAETHLERSLRIYEELGDRRGQGRSLLNLGGIAYSTGNNKQADDYYKQALDIFEELDQKHREANTLTNLGLVATRLVNYQQAAEYQRRSLDIFESIDDTIGQARALNNLGIITKEQGEYAKAKSYYEQSKTLNEQVDNVSGQANALGNLGLLCYYQGEYENAIQYLNQTLEIGQDIESSRIQVLVYNSLGRVYWLSGDYDRSREKYDRGLQISRETGQQNTEIKALVGLATVERKQQNKTVASEYLETAEQLAEQLEDPLLRQEVYQEYAALNRSQNQLGDAAAYLDRVADEVDTDREPLSKLRQSLEACRIAIRQDHTGRAKAHIENAYKELPNTELTHTEGKIHYLQGRIAALRGEGGESREHWQEAIERFETVGAPQDTLTVLKRLIASESHNNVETTSERDADKWNPDKWNVDKWNTEKRGRVREWVETAVSALSAAPEPVKNQHREWVEKLAVALSVET